MHFSQPFAQNYSFYIFLFTFKYKLEKVHPHVLRNHETAIGWRSKNDSTLMFKRFFSFHHTTSCINWVIIRPHHADIKKIAKFSNFSLISHRLVVWKKQKMKIVFACKVFSNKTMNAMHNNFPDKCTIKQEVDFESLDLIV